MSLTAFDKLIGPLRRRVRLMVSRAILSAISDGGGIQLLQVKLLEGEVRDGVERFQEYGLTSVPFPGAEGVMVCVSGSRDHGIVIAVDDRRYRLKGLQAGEVALYDDQGQKVHLTRNGIVVDGAGKPMTVNNTPVVTINASTNVILNTPELKVSGDILDNYNTNTRTVAQMRTIYNGHHQHDSNGDLVGIPDEQM